MNHILVVDDETEIRSSLEEILTEEGYAVTTAATANEALVLIEDAPYDVVLLDIWLPDRDGLDVLADIHALAAEKRPEVVIISGHGTIEAWSLPPKKSLIQAEVSRKSSFALMPISRKSPYRAPRESSNAIRRPGICG